MFARKPVAVKSPGRSAGLPLAASLSAVLMMFPLFGMQTAGAMVDSPTRQSLISLPGANSFGAIRIPVYDFAKYVRRAETCCIEPKAVVLVEGILIFAEAELRKRFDIKVYADTDADLRFIRRLRRDVSERQRTVDSVIEQYLSTVRPMHLEFVEPSKRYADVIIPTGGFNTIAVDMVATRVLAVAQDRA